jgi:beta-lactam-binding protein with PASTA domain
MGLWQFVKSRLFLYNLLGVIILIAFLLWLLVGQLNNYTDHGKIIEVPDLIGLTIKEAVKIIEEKELRYSIVDSMFSQTAKKGSIYEQEPKPNSKVKRNRIIYLYVIARSAEKVSMPSITDVSIRQAKAILEATKLKVGNIQYVPHPAKGLVIRQKIWGKDISSGTLLTVGTAIDLEVGQGGDDFKVNVPDLMGLSFNAAEKLLFEYSLNIGAISYCKTAIDTAEAVICKQRPGASENIFIPAGSSIDVWLEEKTEGESTDTI